MNICLVGDFSENLDEGYKNTAYYLAKELEKNHTISRINVKKMKSVDFLHQLAKIKPDVVHTIAQPTNKSLFFSYCLGQLWTKTPTVISALRPSGYFKEGQIGPFQQSFIKRAMPNLILVQNQKAEKQFESLGCRVLQLPNGVDLEKFKPVSARKREVLRERYKLDLDLPVVLHVGHLKPNRNLLALTPLPDADIQVVVAGSLYMGRHQNLIDELRSADYHIFEGYQPNIAELYQLADYYVFPLKPGNSLAMPLSVLEAMACNLPIITSRFSGLIEAFPAGESLKYVKHTDCFLSHIQEMEALQATPQTREMVKAYSWLAIAQKLEAYYEELLKQ